MQAAINWISAIWMIAWVVVAGCHSGKQDEVATPGKPRESAASASADEGAVPGLDTSELTDHEQGTLAQLLQEQLSPCGDPMPLLDCAKAPGNCGACVPAARYVARLVSEGYEPRAIGEQYKGRFLDKNTAIEMGESPVRGAPMAATTIVEFSDFQCPYCGRAHPLVADALAQLEGKVKLVFKHFPLPGHPRALPAAKAAEAARMQGKFWEMHDMLFGHQAALEDSDLIGYAQQLGLDVDRFKQDMTSAAVAERVERDQALGRALGVDATPSLFINGRRFAEAPRNLLAYLKEEVDL